MPIVAVIGVAGSSAARVAGKLAALVLAEPIEVRLAESATGIDAGAEVLVFADDGPAGKDNNEAERTAILARLGEARSQLRRIAILPDRKAADRWLRAVKDEGLPPEPAELRRVFVASGHSQESHDRAARFAEAFGLPLIEPEDPEGGASAEGWGPRYAGIAAGERWVVHSPSWHAVEVLAPFADLVVHVESGRADAMQEFPAPNPEARKWRVLFAPWLRRYPAVEAQLLAREIAGHAHEAPVFRIRSSAEGEAVLQGFLRGAAERTR